MASLYVEGYADQLSYCLGEKARLCVSTSAERYAVEIARLGAVREVVWQCSDLPGVDHPVPEDASSQGCGWPVSCEVKIAATWRSGYYEVVLRVEDGGGSHREAVEIGTRQIRAHI